MGGLMLQVFLVVLVLGYIVLHAHEMRDTSGAVEYRRHIEIVPEQTPVAPVVAQQGMTVPPLAHRGPNLLELDLAGIVALKEPTVATDRLLARITGYALESAVHV